MSIDRKLIETIALSLVILIFTTACSSSTRNKISTLQNTPTQMFPVTTQVPPAREVSTLTPIPSFTHTLQPSQTPSPSPSPSATRTSTQTFTPTVTFSPSPSATYAILRAKVLEQSNCRYGPGAAYLYKYGLYEGFNIEVIGRNEMGTWVVIQAIGGSNPCWVKASLLNIAGDVLNLQPMSLPLPQSPFYGPLTGVSAQRTGNNVIISWNPLLLRAGDDSLQYPYLVEAWLCQAGKLVFTPMGSWETIVTVQDESGCPEPSHARVYGVEKHGYTSWVEVPWPTP